MSVFVIGICKCKSSRITSYNVCYTKLLRARFGISNHYSGINITQSFGIFGLVIFRHIRGRDKNSRFSHYAKFRYCTSSCTCDYNICYRKSIIHFINKIAHINIRGIKAFRNFPCFGNVCFTGLPYDLNVFIKYFLQSFGDAVIYCAGTKTSSS